MHISIKLGNKFLKKEDFCRPHLLYTTPTKRGEKGRERGSKEGRRKEGRKKKRQRESKKSKRIPALSILPPFCFHLG